MRKVIHQSRIDASDLLAVGAGAVLGLALGYLAGESVGRVNSRRIALAVERWRQRRALRRRRVWTAEDAERLEARVLDALNRDVVLARRPIRVGVLGMGLVELSGRVAQVREVAVASDIVQQVEGVDTVLNHLLVTGVDDTVVEVPGPAAPRAARG